MTEFLSWLEENSIQLTPHQLIVAESYITGASIEALGGHANAFGKMFVMNIVNRYRRASQ